MKSLQVGGQKPPKLDDHPKYIGVKSFNNDLRIQHLEKQGEKTWEKQLWKHQIDT